MRDYEEFKKAIKYAIEILNSTGHPVVAKLWRRQSPFQKARYKDEYVYPEVWLYRPEGGVGAVINGEDIKEDESVLKLIRDALY